MGLKDKKWLQDFGLVAPALGTVQALQIGRQRPVVLLVRLPQYLLMMRHLTQIQGLVLL
jgi:hypothetical protein